MAKVKSIVVDGVEYRPKDTEKAQDLNGLTYVIYPAYSTNIFTRYLGSRNGADVWGQIY